MVTLYVDGKPVGTLADADKLIPEFIAKNVRVEFRDDAGNSVGTFNPTPPLPPGEPTSTENDPDWVKAITPEETARRMAGPFLTLEEMKKRLGWE